MTCKDEGNIILLPDTIVPVAKRLHHGNMASHNKQMSNPLFSVHNLSSAQVAAGSNLIRFKEDLLSERKVVIHFSQMHTWR